MTDACIEYPKFRNALGYGQRSYKGAHVVAHRAAYVEAKGLSLADIKGKVVMHTCDNPACVNPAHLELGTVADNNRDRSRKGRNAKHQPKHRKLSDEQVRRVRANYPAIGLTATAREAGVNTMTVYRIVTGRNYRDVI